MTALTAMLSLSVLPARASELPCEDSSPDCLAQLQESAIANSRQVAVIQQALSVKLSPFRSAIVVAKDDSRLLGDRVSQLSFDGGASELERTRLAVQLEDAKQRLRLQVVEQVMALEGSREAVWLARRRAEDHETLAAVIEFDYASGNRDTTAMIPLWQREEEFASALVQAENRARLALIRLKTLLNFE